MKPTPLAGYLAPEKAKSPKRRWKDHWVIYNSDVSGRHSGSWSLAAGYWDGRTALGIRWNGDTDTRKGSPKSHNYGTWFIVPSQLHSGILAQIESLAPDTVQRAIEFLSAAGD
jgi:hypothetical protein